MQEMQVQSLGQKDPLEESITAHSSVLAWGISWTEKPGGLQSIVLQRVACTHSQRFRVLESYTMVSAHLKEAQQRANGDIKF